MPKALFGTAGRGGEGVGGVCVCLHVGLCVTKVRKPTYMLSSQAVHDVFRSLSLVSRYVNLLVSALSPVNHKGFYQD